MLTKICGYLRNYFERAKFFGKFEIKNGVLISFNDGDMGLLDGQYIRIIGSVLNDGVYQHHADGIEGLSDEAFEGAVWALAIPKAVVDLAEEIKDWNGKYGATLASPYSSESLSANSYSYSKSSAENMAASTWHTAFSGKLSQWRKI